MQAGQIYHVDSNKSENIEPFKSDPKEVEELEGILNRLVR